MFAVAEAIWWFRRARFARRDAALRVRLGVRPSADPLLRKMEEPRTAAAAELLEQAGLDWSLGGWIIRGAIAGFVGLLIGALIGGAPMAFALTLCGPALVYLHVIRARDKRLDKVTQQMPRALEILVLALRAGQSMPRAVELVASEVPAPLGTELRRVAEEHQLGRPIEEAFVAMSSRLDGCEAVRQLVTSILVLRQTGGNLVEVIERIIEMLGANAQYRMRLRAVTSEGRSSGIMLLALPILFAVLAAGADPAYMHLFVEASAGKILAVVAIGLWACGALWIRRLLRAGA